MKGMAIALIAVVAFFVSATACFAQSVGWTVIMSSMDTLASYEIGTIEGGNVNFVRGSSVVTIPVDSVKILVRHNEPHFWSSAGYGTLTGATVGAIAGLASYQKPTGSFAFDPGLGVTAFGSAILGGLAGFTIGGIVGAVSGSDDVYDLTQATTIERVQILQDLRRKSR